MKFLHYYASEPLLEYECEQPNPLELATSMLTQAMLRVVVGKHAVTSPPYVLSVPRSILYEVHEWNSTSKLFLVYPIREAANDAAPIATAELQFPGLIVCIHARRCLPYSEMGAVMNRGNAEC